MESRAGTTGLCSSQSSFHNSLLHNSDSKYKHRLKKSIKSLNKNVKFEHQLNFKLGTLKRNIFVSVLSSSLQDFMFNNEMRRTLPSLLRLSSICQNHTDCKCKIAETIQRGLTEMLQVEIVFFSPSVKGSTSNTITKKAKLARLHISTAEVKVSIDFQCMSMPELFFWFSYISAGLICYSSVHN